MGQIICNGTEVKTLIYNGTTIAEEGYTVEQYNTYGTERYNAGISNSISLLWTNTNTDKIKFFGAQTISLDLSKYTGIIIKTFNETSLDGVYTYAFCKINEHGALFGTAPNGGSYSYLCRHFNVTNTSVVFGNCNWDSTPYNYNAVPWEIYGALFSIS